MSGGMPHLEALARDVRVFLFRQAAETARVPQAAEIAGALRRPEEEIRQALKQLAAAKVPILVLNATTLNTGHNWQFTASWMGEPPTRIETDIDARDWLRRMYYTQAEPAGHGSVRLGDAVAASSCVPGLFEPLVLDKLFPDRTLRLVDGGVHDNPGISALLDQDCNVVLVSDASGQMASVKDVKAGLAGAQ